MKSVAKQYSWFILILKALLIKLKYIIYVADKTMLITNVAF